MIAWLAVLLVSADAQVQDATAARAYLDAGSADGVALGTTVRVTRGRGGVGTCVVDTLAEHASSCALRGAKPGDTARFTIAPRTSEPDAKPPEVTPLTDAGLRAAKRALDDDEPAFEYKAAPQALTARRFLDGSVAFSHQLVSRFDGRDFHVERIDLTLAGTPLGFAGFRAYAAATLDVWSVRPADARFRPGVTAQLYVWQLELSSREVGRPFTLAVGRIWPEHTPGLALVDGAQAGWRSRDGRIEIGAVGGGLPDVLSTTPSFRSWIASAYYAHQLGGGERSTLRTWTHELRVGLRGNPSSVGLDIAGAARAGITKRLWLAGSAQLSLRPDLTVPFFISFGNVQLSAQPHDRVNVGATVQYLGPAVDDDLPGSIYARRLHAFLDAQWRALSWVSIGFSGGAAHDLDAKEGATRVWLGPELVFPKGLFGHGSVSVGYREEIGEWAGRTFYAQAATSSARWHVVARLSYMQDRTSATVPIAHELSVFARADLRVVRWLALRASLLLRGGLTEIAGPQPVGVNGQLGVAGYF